MERVPSVPILRLIHTMELKTKGEDSIYFPFSAGNLHKRHSLLKLFVERDEKPPGNPISVAFRQTWQMMKFTRIEWMDGKNFRSIKKESSTRFFTNFFVPHQPASKAEYFRCSTCWWKMLHLLYKGMQRQAEIIVKNYRQTAITGSALREKFMSQCGFFHRPSTLKWSIKLKSWTVVRIERRFFEDFAISFSTKFT